MDINKDQNIAVNNQMNESWHIPRASLAGSSAAPSSNSSNKSNSNQSTVSRNFRTINYPSHKKILNDGQLDRQQIASQKTVTDGRFIASSQNNLKNQPKRGSRSSQGSSDSNSSTQSTSSGSLLLTAANLERFAEIHRQQNKSYLDSKNEFLKSHYNANLMIASNQLKSNKDAVISIEPNLNFIKTKDMDTMSVASSTHFTMVNGEGGPSRKTTGGICSRGKQVTVLIVSMSLFFLIVILGMVYALEMRAREMPKS